MQMFHRVTEYQIPCQFIDYKNEKRYLLQNLLPLFVNGFKTSFGKQST